MRLALLPFVICMMQACGGDDAPPVTPAPATTPPRPSASSTASEPAPNAPNGRTAGSCGATTSSVSFGSADDGTSNVPKEGINGVVVDGDTLYVAGSRFETESSEWIAKLDAHRTPTWSKMGAPKTWATSI